MKRITVLLSILVALIVIYVSFLIATNQSVRQSVIPSSGGTPTSTPARNFTVLTASPSASTVAVGGQTTLIVNIDTGANKVISTQLEMVFNSDNISVLSVEPLKFFTNPTVIMKKIDNTAGTISYVLGATDSRMGQGELAKIVVMGKKSTKGNSTPITFLPATNIGESGTLTSVLKDTVGANVIVK